MNWIPRFALTPEQLERFLKNVKKNFSSLDCSQVIALHVEEPSAHEIGAPQNVELLYRLLNVSPLPVHYAGGVFTVHVVELLFTLGVSKVVIEGLGLTKWERAVHFAGRFGERCIPRVRGRDFANEKFLLEVVNLLKKAGFSRIIYTLKGETSINTDREMNWFASVWGNPWWLEVPFADGCNCNLEELSGVGIEAIIAPVERFLGTKKRK